MACTPIHPTMTTSASLGYGGQLLPPLAVSSHLVSWGALPDPFMACSQQVACARELYLAASAHLLSKELMVSLKHRSLYSYFCVL